MINIQGYSRARGFTAFVNPLRVVSDRVGGVWKPPRLGMGVVVGGGGEGGGGAVPERRAVVQGGT